MAGIPVVKVKVSEELAKEINAPLKRLWDNYAVIGEVRKSDRIKFVIGAGVRDGVKYINIREFYHKKSEDTWKPGRDGITVPLRIPVDGATQIIEPYSDFIKILAEAAEALEVMELEDEDNAVYIEQKERK